MSILMVCIYKKGIDSIQNRHITLFLLYKSDINPFLVDFIL